MKMYRYIFTALRYRPILNTMTSDPNTITQNPRLLSHPTFPLGIANQFLSHLKKIQFVIFFVWSDACQKYTKTPLYKWHHMTCICVTALTCLTNLFVQNVINLHKKGSRLKVMYIVMTTWHSKTCLQGTPLYSKTCLQGTPLYSETCLQGTPLYSKTCLPGTPLHSKTGLQGTPLYPKESVPTWQAP